MNGKKNIRWQERVVSCLLALAMLLSLCAGCGRTTIQLGSSDVIPPPPSEPEWIDVQMGTEIDTLNVVLVIDTSGSTLKNDPDRNWIEASCMFLTTLYASASKRRTDRLSGSKNVRLGVVLYNDVMDSYSETLRDLSTKDTADALKTYIRQAKTPAESGDSALAEALDCATKTLYEQSKGQEGLSERSVVLLFTDGYTGYKATGAAAPVPSFGNKHDPQLETALKRAKDNNYEIFVLMWNPKERDDGGWEQFTGIADYTKSNYKAKLMPILMTLSNNPKLEGMPGPGDFKWPENYNMPLPPFISDPIYGGGIFPGPDGEKVTYLMANSLANMMNFYVTLAASMLSGSTAQEYLPTIEGKGHEENNCYNIQVPNESVSALLCFFSSTEGISGVNLKGPDPDRPGEQKEYTESLRHQDGEGWANNGTMRNDWYTHQNILGEAQNNIVALTIINPEPGVWTAYVHGKDDNNRPIHSYAAMVSGADVKIAFRQGDNPKNQNFPVTCGDFAVQICKNGDPMTEEFYKNLEVECSATRIPPWVPIHGEKDIEDLMRRPYAWMEKILSDFKKPEKWLTQMSGGEINFKVDKDGIPPAEFHLAPFFKGRFEAPLPGLYYVALNMTSGNGPSLISYSKSFWAEYEPRSDCQEKDIKLQRDEYINPPFLPEKWGKTSNTTSAEELTLNIVEGSLSVWPDTTYADVRIDSGNHPQRIVVHPYKQGNIRVSFDVTTEYGDTWTLTYPFYIK